MNNFKIKAGLLSVVVTAGLLALSAPIYRIHPKIDVTFATNQDKAIEYQVFYTTEKDQKFSGEQSVKQVVPAGAHSVKMTLPVCHIEQFRLDPGENPGDVTIMNLALTGEGSLPLNLKEFNHRNMSRKAIEANKLVFESDFKDPMIIYNKAIEINPRKDIDWCVFGALALVYLLVAYRLFLRMFRVRNVTKTKK